MGDRRAADAPPARRGRGGRGRLRRASAAHPPREHVQIDPARRSWPRSSRPAWTRGSVRVHPECILVAGRGPDGAPGMERGSHHRAGPGLRVRGRRARRRSPATGSSMPAPHPEGRRRSSPAGSERRDGSSPGISGRNARRWSGACSSGSGSARGSPHPRRHPTRRPWSLRPGARRRPVHGDRVGAPAAGAPVARPPRRALAAGSPPGRDRGRRRRPPPRPGGASCTRCARSLARRPTPRATRSSGTARISTR